MKETIYNMKEHLRQQKPHVFIDKALFFPKERILVIGDLHLGFEEALRQSGILVPERQIKDIIENIKKIFSEIEANGWKTEKIVFLGDIKHAFYFEKEEKRGFNEIMDFLQNNAGFSNENIILIKGNHDTMDYSIEKKMKPYHIESRILFVHGHKPISEAILKKANTIVMGHTHPCVIFSEGVKKEVYKCFLEGKFKDKTAIVLPSFMDITEGTPVNYYNEDYIESFSLIPKRDIMKFRVWAVAPNGKEVLDFGRIKELK